ncbi:MAG TPA: hypothetical protein VK094_06465 [Pseudogracilibacillus sp.]|nr:hypothetical protein [Pseudogracilibacillus sp.]
MLERKEYYVSIEDRMLEKIKKPGQAELKIYATEEEVKTIQDYMDNKGTVSENYDNVQTSSKGNVSASYTPSVGDEENYNNDFDKLVDLIYKLGTEKTKKSLEQYR